MPFFKSTYEYVKTRKTFGRQPLFQMVPGHVVDAIYPDKEMQKLYALRNPVHRFVQATLPQSEHDCNTKQLILHDTSINHAEGGWPREVNWDHEEQVNRHVRRVLHDDGYVSAVKNMAPTIQHCIDQNNAIEMYTTYFSNMPKQELVEKYSIKISNTFRDELKRPVSSIIWTNEKNTKLAVSHYSPIPSHTTRDGSSDYLQNNCYIWDIHEESTPLHVLRHEDACWRLATSPVNPEILIGGMENGTVNIFDLRSGDTAVRNSSVFHSHSRPITGLLFLHSRTNNEIFTGSPDGQCLWWDLRKLSHPVDSLPMAIRIPPKAEPSIKYAEGVSALQYDRNLPTRFLCGTESGLVINVNRMGKTHSEILTSFWEAHCGPVRALHRSPCFLRMFMTCGDYTVRIWSEEIRAAPIIVTRPYRHQVTDIAWAPRRFSSYMSICEGGVFRFWDLLRKYKEPVAQLQVSDYPLTKITPHGKGELIAIGDNIGSTFLLQLSEKMTVSANRDRNLVLQMYERERRREHILDNRVKELNLKRRAEEEALALHETLVEDEGLEEEEIDKETEEKYFEIVNQYIQLLGGSEEHGEKRITFE
ncbi:dynein intermediate chain 3, ciliary-like [Pectinophora gossypiella]|uniref:dynein intermediate chain 3, ciliary-like n=1 Tax=Pectinophora gossypiella TaxID=13191 RepID=UPI00214EA2B2|nr:dynein intermediate chain 3, ciliary-like [Pectinophora gossypiella]